MIENNEILAESVNKEALTKKEKFKILRSKIIDMKIVEYLINRLKYLKIEVLSDYKGSIFELMPDGKLEGWCWQTTESAIVFFNDDDYIERGYLKLNEKTLQYYHSWICFKFNELEYVLDPCLGFICKKEDYFNVFETLVKGKVTAQMVSEELIRQLEQKNKSDYSMDKISQSDKRAEAFLKKLLGNDYESYQKQKGVIVKGAEDINAPLYRNSAGYKAEICDGKIKTLTVHYYDDNF